MFGYLFGGEFARGTTDVFDFQVDVDDDATYGIRIGYNITENFEIKGLKLQVFDGDVFFLFEEFEAFNSSFPGGVFVGEKDSLVTKCPSKFTAEPKT